MPEFTDTKTSDGWITRRGRFSSTDDLNHWRLLMPYPSPNTHYFRWEYIQSTNKNAGALPDIEFGMKPKTLDVIARETNNFADLTVAELRGLCDRNGIVLDKPGLDESGNMIKEEEKTALIKGLQEFFKGAVSHGEKSYSPSDSIAIILPEVESLTDDELETKAALLHIAGPFQRLKNRKAGRQEKLIFISKAMAKRGAKEPVEV